MRGRQDRADSFLSRASNNTHDFMFVPMQYWGGLFLIGGIGMLAAHFVMDGDSASAQEAPCVELTNILSTCTHPGAAMLGVMCTQMESSVQTSCLSCVRSSADPCNPGRCQSACALPQ